MARRTDQRREAVFAIYQHDLTKRPIDSLFERETAAFTKALAHATLDNRPEIDELIARHSQGWAIDRIAPLDKAILRVAALEILHPEYVQGEKPIPAEGAIDEAVELAKEYCGAESPGFVNGLLGAVLRERQSSGSPRA